MFQKLDLSENASNWITGGEGIFFNKCPSEDKTRSLSNKSDVDFFVP